MFRSTWLTFGFVFAATAISAHAVDPATEPGSDQLTQDSFESAPGNPEVATGNREATSAPSAKKSLQSAESNSPVVTAAGVETREANKQTGPIHSLLIDKEFPLTGIKWGGQIFVDVPLGSEPQGAQITLRRAQLAFWKTFNSKWSFKLTALYGSGRFNLSDNYVVYSGWQAAVVKFGVFDAPFSLESLSSSGGLTFMERSLPVYALSESKNGGLGFLKRTPKSIISAAVFAFSPKQDDKAQSGQALVMHYVYSPIKFLGKADIHVGGSISYRINASDAQTEFKSRPEIATADDSFVDTGAIPGIDKIFRFGLEASKVMGRFSWQTELLSARVERVGYEDVTFNGAYVYASWFLTDDSRNYDVGSGYFRPVTPRNPLFKGGKGAFELAARASYVDLTDQDIIGGKESNVSLGLNWYLNSQFRIMTNVVKVLSVDRPGSEYDDQTPWIFALRLQWQML